MKWALAAHSGLSNSRRKKNQAVMLK